MPDDTDERLEDAPARSAPSRYTTIALLALPAALCIWLLAHVGEPPPIPRMHSSEGAIVPAAAMPKPAMTARPAHPAAPLPLAAAPAAAHVTTAPAIQSPLPAQAARSEAGKPTDAARGREQVQKDLAIARESLQKSNLTRARSAIIQAIALQPGNPEVQQMRAQLLDQEQQRESILGVARLCATQSQWNCVWHNAGNALLVDSSSVEAKSLLSRAMDESESGNGGGTGVSRRTEPEPPGTP